MLETKTDVLQYQAQLAERLALWSGFSITAGIVMTLLGNQTLRGIGSQFTGWGLIDLAISWFGLHSTGRKAATLEGHEPAAQVRLRTRLKQILWVNVGLDVGYLIGGALLAKDRRTASRFWHGAGLGILAQGGFLLFFDLIHALLLTDRQTFTRANPRTR